MVALTRLDAFSFDFTGPPEAGYAASYIPKGVFNPSLTLAPPNLLTRARYVVAFRVSSMHRCSARAPLYTFKGPSMAWHWFDGARIALLDENMRILRQTWAVYIPEKSISSERRNISRFQIPYNAHDDFLPAWGRNVYDMRLFNVDDRIWATFNVAGNRWFALQQLQLNVDRFGHFRAWVTSRRVFPSKALAGKNWALFSKGSRVFVQVHMGTIYEVKYSVKNAQCVPGSYALCGSLRKRQSLNYLKFARLVPVRTVSDERTARICRLLRTNRRLSMTSHLIRLADDHWLGIGHIHFQKTRAVASYFNYTHFYYVLNEAMFVTKVTPLFKFDATNSIEFASGLCLSNRDALVTLGVNDCTSHYARVPLDAIQSRMITV